MAIPIMQTKQAAAALSALARESRLAIGRLLLEHAPAGLAASAIVDKLRLANATLTFHLKELVVAGLITRRQDSGVIYYSPVLDAIAAVVDFLTENCCNASGGSCKPASAERLSSSAPPPDSRRA